MSVGLIWGISAALAAPVTAAPATGAPANAAPVAAPTAVQRPTVAPAPTAAPVAAPAPTAAPVAAPAPVATPYAPAPVASAAVAPSTTPPPVVAPAPVASGPMAAQLLAEGRLLEAALEYEDAWRDGGQPSDLLGAATAREAMGHRGHAAAYLRELVARGHGDPTVTTRLAALEASLVPVKVVVTTPEAGGELVVLARYRGRAADARPDLVLRATPTRGRTAELQAPLDAGRWDVWVADEYYTESRQQVTVTGGVAPVVQLEPIPRDRQAEEAGRRGSPVVLLLGVGVGLLAGGQVETKRVIKRSDIECSQTGFPCRDLMARGVSLRSAGAGLLGSSVGLVAAHLVKLSPKRRVRRAVWATEAGLGLVGVVAGSVGVALSARSYNGLDYGALWTDEALQASLKQSTTQHTVAAFFLGFGAGMLVRSVGYLVDMRSRFGRARRDRGERKGPIAFSPMSAGGVMTARF